jgi:manganese/zinc/iron transport system permease protein
MTNNPYFDQDFLGFLWVLLGRLFLFAKGDIGLTNLAADEVQMSVLALVAISSGLIGTFLILRRMTMLANAYHIPFCWGSFWPLSLPT